jgi:hypothetical protein
MNFIGDPMQYLRIAILVALSLPLGGCMHAYEFGIMDIASSKGVLFHGNYFISPSADDSDRGVEKQRKLRIRFYGEDTALFDHTYSVLCDSSDIVRRNLRTSTQLEFEVRNKNGSIAFRRVFGILGGKPGEISEAPRSMKSPKK